MERDSVYTRHILDAISTIKEYLKEISNFEDFSKNKVFQDGFIRQLEIIGEAAKRLSKNFRNSHSDIPWDDICGMRDKLIHDYFGVDLKAVWQAVKEDVPDLKKKLEEIVKEKV